MRRLTACFSMYSDMSMRIIAPSLSNMNSASARANSVLPTPVGPRKIKLPSGRLGSDNPARDRRIASDTAWIASSCPMTRPWRRVSIWISFSISPSIRRLTGMPVQRLTTSAISSLSTSSLRSLPLVWSLASFSSSCCKRASSSLARPYWSSAALL